MSTEQTSRPRNTKQRQVIRDLLKDTEEFLTAQQIFQLLREKGESIGLATVYRTLQALQQADQVDSIHTPEGELAYRSCSDEHHHHLICRECGKAIEIGDPIIGEWAQRVASEHGFVDVEHVVEIYGTCPSCVAGE